MSTFGKIITGDLALYRATASKKSAEEDMIGVEAKTQLAYLQEAKSKVPLLVEAAVASEEVQDRLNQRGDLARESREYQAKYKGGDPLQRGASQQLDVVRITTFTSKAISQLQNDRNYLEIIVADLVEDKDPLQNEFLIMIAIGTLFSVMNAEAPQFEKGPEIYFFASRKTSKNQEEEIEEHKESEEHQEALQHFSEQLDKLKTMILRRISEWQADGLSKEEIIEKAHNMFHYALKASGMDKIIDQVLQELDGPQTVSELFQSIIAEASFDETSSISNLITDILGKTEDPSTEIPERAMTGAVRSSIVTGAATLIGIGGGSLAKAAFRGGAIGAALGVVSTLATKYSELSSVDGTQHSDDLF